MALVLKRLYQGYFYLMDEVADPRVDDFPLMSSPFPTIIILYFWYKFVFNWGPSYMKNREPFELKHIMIVYNVVQVITNAYIVHTAWSARGILNWHCAEVDYSRSYWGMKFLKTTYLYYLLKLADLIDTVFFVLRKKSTHISFLHTYHHFGMVCLGWIGTKFIGGGHSYFLGLANCIVHTILYSYYLLTSYDSRYGKLVWLKKFITQAQLIQFAYLMYAYGKLLFIPSCKFPKVVTFFFVPQNFFMIILFGDFYVRTYILAEKKKKAAQKEAVENKESMSAQ